MSLNMPILKNAYSKESRYSNFICMCEFFTNFLKNIHIKKNDMRFQVTWLPSLKIVSKIYSSPNVNWVDPAIQN